MTTINLSFETNKAPNQNQIEVAKQILLKAGYIPNYWHLDDILNEFNEHFEDEHEQLSEDEINETISRLSNLDHENGLSLDYVNDTISVILHDRYKDQKAVNTIGLNYDFLAKCSNEKRQEIYSKFTRLDLIQWLQFQDKNGVYLDSLSIGDTGSIMSKQDAIESIEYQLTFEL